MDVPTLIERRVGNCGCPEEEWIVEGFNLEIHLEDGRADIYADNGDCDATTALNVVGMDAARVLAFAWLRAQLQGAGEPHDR